MAARLVPFLLIAALGGCVSAPHTPGPWFSLPPPPEPPAEPALPVEVIDARPRWERHGHEGAFTFVSLEKFKGSPLDHIVAEVRARTEHLAERPSRATVRLLSFRTIINDEEEQWAAHALPVQFTASDDGDIVGTLVGTLLAGAVECGVRRALHPEDFRPARLLPLDYPPGVTCDIHALVTLSWPGGSSRDVDVSGRAGEDLLPEEEQGQVSHGNAVPLLVQEAVRQLGINLVDRLVRNADSRPPPPPPAAEDLQTQIDAAFR